MCTFTSAASVNFRPDQKYTEKVGSGLYDKDDYGKHETWSIQEIPSRRDTKDTSVLNELKKKITHKNVFCCAITTTEISKLRK